MLRAERIDILKGGGSFLIVCIHVPFPGTVGSYFTTLTRVAVPLFFMITGYFYSSIRERHGEKNQIRKLLLLGLGANCVFLLWNIVLRIWKGDSVVAYVQSLFTWKNVVKFLILNESPLAGHLWYLGAILYVLVIVLLIDKLNYRKMLYCLTPALLIIDLVFGKYSLLVFNREFPFVLVRNFLCVGIPYFCIGRLIREKKSDEKLSKNVLSVLIVIFALTSIAEKYVLVNAGINGTRDHYISTTFLAVSLFLYTLKSDWKNKVLAAVGREYSTLLYVIHPIFISAFAVATDKLGIITVYEYFAPIVVYCATLLLLVAIKKYCQRLD